MARHTHITVNAHNNHSHPTDLEAEVVEFEHTANAASSNELVTLTIRDEGEHQSEITVRLEDLYGAVETLQKARDA